MDRIDDYLQTLRILLPRDKRDDIVLELSEEIRSQESEQASVLGRPLSPAEQGGILRKYGHPLLTAARYRPQRYLIGPVVFPYYAFALGAVLALVFVGHAIGAIVLLANGEPLGPVLENTLGAVLSGIGWFTLVAACVEIWLVRSGFLEKWDPNETLPPFRNAAEKVRRALDAVPGGRRPPAGSRNTDPPRGKTSAPRFVAAIALAAWWLLGLRFPYLFFGPGAANMDWGVAMDRLYPILVTGQIILLVQCYRELVGASDIRFGRLASIASGLLGVAFVYLVATSDHQWLVWLGGAGAPAQANVFLRLGGLELSAIDFVNLVFSAIFLFVGVAAVVGSIRSLFTRSAGGGRRIAHA